MSNKATFRDVLNWTSEQEEKLTRLQDLCLDNYHIRSKRRSLEGHLKRLSVLKEELLELGQECEKNLF
jgi:hypothetical protein